MDVDGIGHMLAETSVRIFGELIFGDFFIFLLPGRTSWRIITDHVRLGNLAER